MIHGQVFRCSIASADKRGIYSSVLLQKRHHFRPSHLGCDAAPVDIEAVIGPGKKVGLMINASGSRAP